MRQVDKNSNTIELHAFTGCEWLDIVQIHFSRYNPQNSTQFYDRGCVASVPATEKTKKEKKEKGEKQDSFYPAWVKDIVRFRIVKGGRKIRA